MQKVLSLVRKGILYGVALVLAAGYPLSAMADTQDPVTDPATTTTTTTTTETTPTETDTQQDPPLTYTYDPVNEKWNSEKWQYNPATGTYEPTPAPTIVEPTPSSTDGSDQTVDKTVDTNVTIDNTVTSDAASGDVSVLSNTTAGGATTGDAAAMATLLNTVNSTITTGENQKVATFTQDILGDVNGDIVLYPMLLKAMLEAKAGDTTANTVNATTNFDINNDLMLNAKSGDATVAGNTTGGDATTGSATAVANVVNILNSMIAAQDSFIGTINIYGNLNGDILIAPDFIPQMLANNSTGDTNTSTQISQQDSTTIVNNISAVAESGAASVFSNTTGGNATTGDASSNIVIFNVTGHEIIAANSLLVFVNVLGKWVGMIVDAPEGATAAMLGDGVTTNTNYAPDLTVNSQSNHGIVNTIAVTAESGDATVAHNTTGGNATTGNARAMVNVANMSGNQLGLTGWFGVLFINVYQNWFGSFGIDTAYGDPETPEAVNVPKPTGPIQFIPTSQSNGQKTNVRYKIIDSRTVKAVDTVPETAPETQAVLASATTTGQKLAKAVTNDAGTPQDYRLWVVAGSLLVIGLSVLGLRRLLQ